MKPPIRLADTVHVGRVETLADVLRLLESLDDMQRRESLGGIILMRVREEPKKKTEQAKGRRFVG